MKRKLFTRTMLISVLSSALLSFTACKSDEDKCIEGDQTACQQVLAKGTWVDKRDGKMYKIVKIGSQTWMAENLKVRTEGSWCYEDKESNCQKYGRLYNWDAAKVACPAGWHLPSKEEFEALFVAVSGEDVAGKKLKSTSGWKENGNGDDAFGFSALPAGRRKSDGAYYDGEGDVVRFWSSSEGDGGEAWFMQLDYDGDGAYLFSYVRDWGYSVRCVKD